jgi:hypothetical protein
MITRAIFESAWKPELMLNLLNVDGNIMVLKMLGTNSV